MTGFWIFFPLSICFECISSLNILHLRVLNKILSRIYLTELWVYRGFKICQDSEYIRVLNMSGFIKKTLHHLDVWQGSDYSSGSAYTRVLNMPGLYKVLKKILHHRCLTGFQIILRFWTCHGSKYARVTQGSEQNAPLKISDRVLNMPLVLKWQGYRRFCVNYIPEIHGILNMPQALNVPRFCMYQES